MCGVHDSLFIFQTLGEFEEADGKVHSRGRTLGCVMEVVGETFHQGMKNLVLDIKVRKKDNAGGIAVVNAAR